MEDKAIKRLYYSISEVSRITGIKPYVLRYWETEFKELRPAKNRAGNRVYRKSDIRLLFAIKRLLYEKKFTIEGARQKLHEMRREKMSEESASLDAERINKIIDELRTILQELLEILDEKSKDRNKATGEEQIEE
ncbi:MerR family transcriptional regulator [candidate division KSB1 bacterium]|nr:MerR family transcriptional regulator [candidate division KSB1 bacterium]